MKQQHKRTITREALVCNNKDDIMDLISWLDNAPFLMGKLTERDKATREKIIAIIMGGAR